MYYSPMPVSLVRVFGIRTYRPFVDLLCPPLHGPAKQVVCDASIARVFVDGIAKKHMRSLSGSGIASQGGDMCSYLGTAVIILCGGMMEDRMELTSEAAREYLQQVSGRDCLVRISSVVSRGPDHPVRQVAFETAFRIRTVPARESAGLVVRGSETMTDTLELLFGYEHGASADMRFHRNRCLQASYADLISRYRPYPVSGF